MTNFSMIEFDPIAHSYQINGKNLVSVTTLIKSIAPEFDRDGISLRMAERAGVSQAEILRRWDENGAKSRDKGTRLHKYVEDVLEDRIDPILERTNQRLPEMQAFLDAWTLLRAEVRAKKIAQEVTIGDEQFGVAGRIDNLMSVKLSDSSRVACVFDWKTGKLDVTNQYERLLPPFQAYDNSKFNLYSIQLSMYRLIIERNPQQEAGAIPAGLTGLADGYILHLRDDGSYHIMRARDFRPQILKWLKDGLPPGIQNDPASEKRAGEIVKILDTVVDRPFVRKLSERGRRDLIRAARSAVLISESVGDSDDL